ncbi:hypothetical protein KAM344_40840 [Aeromonas caviae]|jgi:predicted ester cyclase|uniref:Ester cyclase n=2 Tax=Aeromonas caviae TaxID=648 RepID=A0AAV4YR98_AERCA|nr:MULTISPECIES: ester cyclase [Pseudomonadota]MBL0487385.1 ester cyclase [Aeromonas caviae]MBL0555226.1 ester cyclase [Aeromonas caviae]MDH0473278.1 ester cyclase [Aeromonas caviae]MEA9434159.1 ester cyclase [Aeromonas caviae]MEB6643066.1 ester cyclase [Aeromonas caviae]
MRNLMKLGGVLMMAVILMFITVKSYADQSECKNSEFFMNENNSKTIVQRFNKEVIVDLNRKSFDELMSTDFINHSAASGTDNGPNSMWNTFSNVLHPAISNLNVEILDQIVEGDKVVTRKRITGRHTGSLMGIEATGRDVSIDVIDIIRVKNGQYAEHWGLNTFGAVIQELKSAEN